MKFLGYFVPDFPAQEALSLAVDFSFLSYGISLYHARDSN